MAILSLEQLNTKHNLTPTTTPTGRKTFSLEEIQKRQVAPPTPAVEEKPKRSVFGKVAGFLAPTATKAFEKVKAGEKLGLRDIAGSALEIGSFLLPVGAIGRGLGLAGKGAITGARALKAAKALSLAKKVKLGAVAGGLGGALSSAGEAIGEKGTRVSDVTSRAIGGGLIGAGFGAALPVVGRGISKAIGFRGAKITQKAEQVALLRKGVPETSIARKTLTEAGEVVSDPKAIKAIRQGIPEADVAVIKGASALDKQKMSKMLNIRKSQLTNKRITSRATDVVGDTFLEQAKFIEQTNKNAGKRLGVVAQKLGGKKVDPTNAITEFANQLDNSGIKVNKKNELSFKGSAFEGLKAPQSAIRNVWIRAMRIAKSNDALQMHRTKSFIDEVVDYGKAAEGLSGRAQRILKGFRRNIDGILDTSFPEYNRVNTIFAETIQQLDSISNSMGRKFKLGDTFASAKAGVTMRRILSNTQSRSDILQLLESMQGVAKKHGFKVKDDIINQTLFADTLEKMLGSEAPTSFLGQIERGVSRFGGVAEAGADIVRGKPVSGLIKAGKAATDVLRGRNQENLIKALDDLLGVKPRTVFGRPKITPIVKKKDFNVLRYTDKDRLTTEYRGGRWFLDSDSATKDATKLYRDTALEAGGKTKIKGVLETKKPLVIKLDDDSLITQGGNIFKNEKYNKILSKDARNKINLLNKHLDSGIESKNVRKKMLESLGVDDNIIKSIENSDDNILPVADHIISNDLSKKGYDALVLEDLFGERNIFSFGNKLINKKTKIDLRIGKKSNFGKK